ncbi:hypothetical protein M422DRAFT_254757 [Sphaerobolus stellatus SS14]|uniref:Uncharacterized protein n=1 Tax=Sphaerobolus stellatus (strain SS14) TaxID=990650 RepID=A0A0C9VK85_SPHS4|nr:hypothetical protein M422DRAFT_254757 [Sphaerobolus stellatus SS14]
MINQSNSNASLAGSEISLVDSFFLLADLTGAEGHTALPRTTVEHHVTIHHASALPHDRHPRAAIALRAFRMSFYSVRLSSTTIFAARIASLPTRHPCYRCRSLFLPPSALPFPVAE